jgi:hypothetical protein
MASAADDAARQARLNQLVSAVQAWQTSRTNYLTQQLTTAQNIMNGRTGSANSVANAGTTAASALVGLSVNDFLSD